MSQINLRLFCQKKVEIFFKKWKKFEKKGKKPFLYFVTDFFIASNHDFILFCHTMAEKLTNVKKQVEKIFFHLFLGKTSGKNIFPLVFGQNKWKKLVF